MKKTGAFLLVFCLLFSLAACQPAQNTDGDVAQLRDNWKEHEFLGVTFYLPDDFTQSNIFADTDTGRIEFTDAKGIRVLINVHETAYINQYYKVTVSDAQSYAQVYYDSHTADYPTIDVALSSKHGVPVLRLCGEADGAAQYGLMGFYYADAYCACIALTAQDQDLFTQKQEMMTNAATVATFTR